MNKYERNERIVAGLYATGTLAGAARHAGVDRGTVRRLLAHHEPASDALVGGRQRLLMARVRGHATKVTAAYQSYRRSHERVQQQRRRLATDYAIMDAEQIRQAEAELLPLVRTQCARLRDLKQRDRRHARSLRRYAEACAGMEP